MKADSYDRVINWERRLEREWPFYEQAFREHGVETVLDCACGTGRHAALFAKKGLRVTGSDISPEMIERAKANAARAGAGVEFRVAAFSDLAATFSPGSFDAVVCTGNSLSQLPDIDEVIGAVRGMAAVCRPGGLVVLHILNYRSLLRQQMVVRPLRVTGDGLICQKVFLPRTDAVDVIFVTLRKGADGWSSDVSRGTLFPILPVMLKGAVSAAGFSIGGVYGDYARAPFDGESSWDMIVTGIRNDS